MYITLHMTFLKVSLEMLKWLITILWFYQHHNLVLCMLRTKPKDRQRVTFSFIQGYEDYAVFCASKSVWWEGCWSWQWLIIPGDKRAGSSGGQGVHWAVGELGSGSIGQEGQQSRGGGAGRRLGEGQANNHGHLSYPGVKDKQCEGVKKL